MKKQFKRWLAAMLIAIMTTNCIQTVFATSPDILNIDNEDYEDDEDDEVWIIDDINGTPSNATPSKAKPSKASSSNATPSNATPSNATPSDATPSNAVEVTTYGELQQALASASNGTRIAIMKDMAPDDGTIKLNEKLDAVTGATLVVTAEDVSVEGNDFTIYGKGYPTFDSDGGDLTVENLTIDGAGYQAKIGGAVFVEYGGKLTMKNVTMKNCSAGSSAEFGGGGAVYVNNHGGATPTFTAVNCHFIGNSTPKGRGGAVYGSTGNVILDKCTFVSNEAANGGAVAMDGICSLTMTNCKVNNNIADVSGGGVYIYHGNSNWKKSMILTSRVTADINASNEINGNTAGLMGDNIVYGRYYNESYTGDKNEVTLLAPVYDELTYTDISRSEILRAGAEVEVRTYGELQRALATASNGTRVLIKKDLAPDDGSISLNDKLDAVTGATLVVTAEEVSVEGNNCTIYGKGYPTFDSDGGDLTVENLTIEGAGYHAKIGGAVFVEYGGKLTMKNVTMKNCSAGSSAEFGGGGAVYVNNHGGATPTFTAVNCHFIGNSTPNGRGGAVYGSTGNVILDKCTFVSNEAANGGAVAMDGTCSLTMTDCKVVNNTAKVSGGGVYIYHGNSKWKKNMILTSRVTAAIDDSNQIVNNTADLAGNNILYGRYYSADYSDDRTETTLIAPVFDDITFTSLERNQIGKYYLEKVNDTWYLRCDTENDISVILKSIKTVTVDGKTVSSSEVFDSAGAVRLDELTVFPKGSKDCYSITIDGGIAHGAAMLAGDLSLDRWNHEAGWISFITYIDSTQSELVSLWKQAAEKNNMEVDQFKAIWRNFCEIGNGIEAIKVNGDVITAYSHDKKVVFKNTYKCEYKIMNGLEDDVTYGFKAQGDIADEKFRYLVLMEPGYDGDGSIAAHYHFRYGADGFDVLFTGTNNYWYPTMCDAGATLEEQCNVLKAMFQLSETNNSSENNNTISSSPKSSSSGGSNTDSSSQWKSDEKGWWYRYDNGTWPSNRWVYLNYNGYYAWYHFDADGYMQTDWFTDSDGYRYYLNPLADGTKGSMKTGWVLINGLWYYFNDSDAGPKGALLISTTTPDGYQVDENGIWIQR